MKYLILSLILLFGCISQQPIPEQGEIPQEEAINISQEEKVSLITVSGDEDVSVTEIKAKWTRTKWQFPIEDHIDEFIGVGLHSDSFIKLNNSHVKFLDDNETIWIHPMIQSGNRTVLFDAIYAREVNCNESMVSILGKEYEMSKLKDGSSFEFDDKWKIGLEKEGDCTKRVVIYLDGYFYDLGNDEQINLFRNDNTILFKFNNIETEPYVSIIGTRPIEDFQKA